PTRRSTRQWRTATRCDGGGLFASVSQRLYVTAYRPHGEISTDELTDPIARHRNGSAEHQRYVLGLSQKAAQGTPLDVTKVLRSLRADQDDALHVRYGQHVIHEVGRLEERSQRYVVERPHQQCPYRPAEQRGQNEAAGLEQEPIKNDRRTHGRRGPDEIQRIVFRNVPLEVSAHPGAHEEAHRRVGRAGREPPCDPLDILERGRNDNRRERRDHRPPLRVLPVRPEIPVPGEQLLGNVRGAADHENRSDPEHDVPLAIDPLVALVEQCAQFETPLPFPKRGRCCSHSLPVSPMRPSVGNRSSGLGPAVLFLGLFDFTEAQDGLAPYREHPGSEPSIHDERPMERHREEFLGDPEAVTPLVECHFHALEYRSADQQKEGPWEALVTRVERGNPVHAVEVSAESEHHRKREEKVEHRDVSGSEGGVAHQSLMPGAVPIRPEARLYVDGETRHADDAPENRDAANLFGARERLGGDLPPGANQPSVPDASEGAQNDQLAPEERSIIE